ncbi:MAG: restriction endonuclease subunit S [Akkermansiaceae bacterium]|nr:restriction endonuclease subunit S [Akkermansiaceae bacterium]
MSKVFLGDVAVEHKETCKGSKDGYPVVGLEHLVPEEITLTTWDEGSDNTFTKMFRKGDVLFGRRRAYLKKAAVAPFDGICSGDITVIEAKPDRILPELLPFIIQNDALFDFAVGKSAGSLSPRVKWEHLKNYEFELPDMDKQKELAELLWAIDDTKKAYQKLISATDELVKSRFMEQFASYIGDETKCSTIENVCTLFADGDWIESKDQSDEGIRLIQTGNVGNGVYLDKGERARFIDEPTFDRLHCTEVLPNDILISRLPDPVGRACVIPKGLGKAITAVDCSIVRLKEMILPEFFVAYTLTSLYASQIGTSVTGSTRKRISRKNLGQVIFPVPSLDIQQQFASFVRQIDKSKFELEQALSELTATYKRIIAENLG